MTAISHTPDSVPISASLAVNGFEYPHIEGKPVVRTQGFFKITGVSRTRGYEMWNRKSPYWDPEFPVGFPLYDSPNSPKVFWVHEALAWLQARSNQHRNQL